MPLVLLAALAVLGAWILIYSQTWAFTGDEGFHLLAAQLIDHGRKPYIDFCFPQTPLNAYLNAGVMRVFGESWRTTHMAAGLFTIGAVALAAQFVYSRMPATNWKTAAAVAAAIGTGLNVVVVQYGPLAQAYGLCLFFTVAAFRLAVAAVDRRDAWWNFAAGLCVGTAAGASLLTATFGPALGLWLLIVNRGGNRWLKLVAFAAGGAIPFAPALWLYLQSPDVARFNLFEYHLFFRKLYWPETTTHDLEIVTSWIDCGQALLLGLLGAAGLLWMRFRSGWEGRLKSEFYLCFWLTAALAVELCTAHPTFSRYFLLMVPFVAILASVGLMVTASALYKPESRVAPVVIWGFLFALGMGTSQHQRLEDIRTWKDMEAIAAKVKEVTPPGGKMFSAEAIYFLLKVTPPPGLEFSYSHELNFGPKKNAALHIIPMADLKKMVASGMFDSASTCDDDDITTFKFRDLYMDEAEAGDCNVFWGKRGK
jgi:hypothetical protein